MGFSLFMLLIFFLLSLSFTYLFDCHIMFKEFFLFNKSGFMLSLMSLMFTIVFIFLCKSILQSFEMICLVVSLLSSMCCFFSANSIMFWVFYELTIIPLLVSLMVNSPYSERFLASWYLFSYMMFTSLPMLLMLVYYSFMKQTFKFYCWETNNVISLVILFLLFITKVPLPPFHAWLPVVHAEASTFVSVVLSGYVMKLGIMGLIRFCMPMMENKEILIFFMFGFSLLFFISSYSELDSKRWLAFLSLSHILISLLGIYFLDYDSLMMSLIFCLGHGLSAALLFYLFMILYKISGTRKWFILSLCDNVSKFWRLIMMISFITLASFPPSFAFLSEIFILSFSLKSMKINIIFLIYIFLGGLMPLVLLSFMLVKSNFKNLNSMNNLKSYMVMVSLFMIWMFGGFLL